MRGRGIVFTGPEQAELEDVTLLEQYDKKVIEG